MCRTRRKVCSWVWDMGLDFCWRGSPSSSPNTTMQHVSTAHVPPQQACASLPCVSPWCCCSSLRFPFSFPRRACVATNQLQATNVTACITVHNGHEWALMAMGCTPHPHLGLLVVNSANALELFSHNVSRAGLRISELTSRNSQQQQQPLRGLYTARS